MDLDDFDDAPEEEADFADFIKVSTPRIGFPP